MKQLITRKTFIFAAAKGALVLSFISLPVKKLFPGLALRQSRTEGVYEQDRKMPFRKSQDNPMVKQIYRDFLEHPNSHKAHELLHTEYRDRSAGLKRLKQAGIKLVF